MHKYKGPFKMPYALYVYKYKGSEYSAACMYKYKGNIEYSATSV